MNKNRIEGVADQGERARNREALVIKGTRRRSGGRAVKELLRRLYGKLRLTVNETKSAATRVFGRKFLGYGFWPGPGGVIKRKVADKELLALGAKLDVRDRRRRTAVAGGATAACSSTPC